jgi:RNA polymerase sigma-70 factor (ECF subfamily)
MNENESHYTKSRDEKDDFSLIKSFHSGDKRAFDIIVLRHKDRIFNLCLRFLGNYHEAEDTAQDIFVKAYGSLNSFRFESSFFTWLYRIAVNTCKNKIKSSEYRLKKMSSGMDNPEGSIGLSLVERLDDPVSNPVSDLEKKETMKALECAIDSLPPDQKSVVILRDIQGMSYEEMTDITGFKLGTLKSKLSRARNTLKEKLGGII